DLVNHGRMLTRTTHWMLVVGTILVCEGDTLVGPLGTVTIARDPTVSLAPGTYSLRAVADTFNLMHETNEANNASTRPLSVGPSGIDGAPTVLDLSDAAPNPARAT